LVESDVVASLVALHMGESCALYGTSHRLYWQSYFGGFSQSFQALRSRLFSIED